MTNPQKTLKTISIIVLALAILTTIAGAIATYFGGMFMVGGAIVVDELGTSEEATMMAGGGLIALLIGITMLLTGIINTIVGIIGLGVAKDGRRVKLYAGMCVFALVCVGISIITTIVEGSFPIISVIDFVVIALAWRCANEIKKPLNN